MNIKLYILKVLHACGTWALSKSTLKVEVQAQMNGRIGDGEFSDALVQLKDKGFIATRIEEISGDTLYFITEAGKTKVGQ
jgi:DNA-binding PadR family transcriptional regulator